MENEEINSYIENGQKYLQCKCCYNYQKVDIKSISVTCSRCILVRTLKLIPLDEMIPSLKKKQITGRPPGWHFMVEYVDTDGNVFHKGKEQPELKGTLKPTKVKPIKKKKKLTADERLFKRAEEYKKKLKAKRKNKK